MDSAKNVLHSVILAVQQVRNATAQYSTTRGIRQVRQHSLICLESQFQTITNASRAILKVLDDPLLCQHYMLDDRLVDWLSGTEPETCLDVLRKMARLISIECKGQVFPRMTAACEEDDLNAAIVLFHGHKTHFHFLLTTDIWNHEHDVHKQAMSSKTEEAGIQGHEQSRIDPAKSIAIEDHRRQIVSQKLKKLLRVLDALDCSEKHRETLSIRQSDTCMWLLATDAYRSWREGKATFLWLQGKPGAGKSVLASSVINDLKEKISDDEFLIYFYCDFRTSRSTSAVEVMRSILAQLMTQVAAVKLDSEGLLDELLRENDGHSERFYSIKGLSNLLSRVAILCSRTPIVVVDALDECREVESLLDGLVMSAGDLRIFATSRPLQNIINMLSPFPCISMDKMASELSADILLHVTRELDSRRRLRTFGEKLKKEIRSKLCAKADGMFRWVQCQIDTLEKCSSVSEIRRVLESLPEGLEETYRRILIAIDRQLSDACLVRRALVWLVGALRPMSMSELLEGIMIDTEYRELDSRFGLMKGADLLEVCRSLVVYHEEADIITLSHMSVKEYLVGELVRVKLPRYHIVLADAHEQLARLCLAYIAFCLEEMKESKGQSSLLTRERDLRLTTSYVSRPLLKYVLSDGFSHLAHLGPDNTGIFKDLERLRTTACQYAWEWDWLCELVPSMRTGLPWPTSQHDFILYTLVAFGSEALFQTFLLHTPLNPQNGTNPLVYAAHFGRTDHARLLISHGANVNDPGLIVNDLDSKYSDADNGGWDESHDDYSDASDVGSSGDCAIPLEIAVNHWYAKMVDLLLAEGSAVPAKLLARVLGQQPHEFPLYITRRLLQTAEFVRWATSPWDNRRLLGVLVDDEEDHEQAELIIAVRQLVQVGCAETLLLAAVENGCVPVIKVLFSVDTSSGLSLASHPNAIVNALATNGDTPLHVAMRLPENRCLIITKLLITGGCNPCQLDANDKPSIHLAVARGFVSVVDYLLSNDVPLPSKIMFTTLQVSLLKRVELIRLLISKGANTCVLNSVGDTLLHVAMRSLDGSVCLEIAEILVDAGCNPSIRNPHGETPLHIAARQGHYEVTNYLLLFSAFPDILSLLHSKESTHVPALRSLIGNIDGLRLGPEDEDRTFQAIRQFLDDQDKCLELAKCFVGAAGSAFANSSGSATLCEIAVIRGFTLVMEYLVSEGVALPTKILFTALRHQRRSVGFLISKGADLYGQEDNGDSLLHVAITTLREAECLTMVELLVEAGCPTATLNAAGVRPIRVAVSRGFTHVVRYLLPHPFDAEGLPDLLFIALRLPHPFRMVHSLLAPGMNMSCLAPYKNHPLHAALKLSKEDECLQITQMLVKAGCSPVTPNAVGKTPLHMAINQGFTSVVNYLISLKVPLPSDILTDTLRSTSVSYLARPHSLAPTLTLLVREGADLHTRDANGNTPLHHAMQLHNESLSLAATEVLVDAGCNASIPNSKGEPPTRIAVSLALTSVVEYLLSRKTVFPPDILLTALNSRRAFHEEVLKMVSLLVGNGADVHVLAPNGDTTLHVALSCEKKWLNTKRTKQSCLLDVVKILVQAGCDTMARNASGCTPHEVAAANRYVQVAVYLKSSPLMPGGLPA